MKKLNSLVLRGFFGTFSILLIALSTDISFAATSNELRKLLDMPENNYGIEVQDRYEEYQDQGNPNEPTNQANQANNDTDNKLKASTNYNNEDRQSTAIYQIASGSKGLTAQREIVEQDRIRAETRIKNNSSAYVIVSSIDQLLVDDKELQKLENSINNNMALDDHTQIEGLVVDEELGADTDDYSIMEESLSSREKEQITSLTYNIGGIGQNAQSVVEHYLKIVTPWGFTKHASDEKFTNNKLLGINLYAREGDNILSQWNGVVVGIGTDKTDDYQFIKIFHGNSTYTFYSHVYPVPNIKVGTVVNQGDIIGVAANSQKYEPEYDNHIFYQVKLDGEYINPILIYGERSKRLYETWLTSYAFDNVVESGEKYYSSNEYEVKENFETDLIKELKYSDFNKES